MRDRPAAPVALTGLYLGVFIGPLMGGVTNVMLPVLQDDFAATLGQVTAAVSAYLVPFVLLQLVSGTIADRFSRGGTVAGGCAAFAASSALAAVAPNIEVFLAARVFQGAANAFTTPVIMATLGDVVPAPRLGRALGTFTTVNTAGLLLAPLLGGVFAETNWRLVFVLLTAVCTALAAYYAWWYLRLRVSAPRAKRPSSAGLAVLVRGLANRRLVLLCIAGWLGYAGINGIAFIVALHLEAAMELGAVRSGAILAGFGLAGMLA
ncbi:MAG: MFS transporter, partial [Chloroflexota bacterium]|nr:MFS transporter [Chloroflexota bacterium]